MSVTPTPSPLPGVAPSTLAKIKTELLSASGIALAVSLALGEFVSVAHLGGSAGIISGQAVAVVSALGLALKEIANSGLLGTKA